MGYFGNDITAEGEVKDGMHEVRCSRAEWKPTKSGGRMFNCTFVVDGLDRIYHSFFVESEFDSQVYKQDNTLDRTKLGLLPPEAQKKVLAAIGGKRKLIGFLNAANCAKAKDLSDEEIPNAAVGLECSAEIKNSYDDFKQQNVPKIVKFGPKIVG